MVLGHSRVVKESSYRDWKRFFIEHRSNGTRLDLDIHISKGVISAARVVGIGLIPTHLHCILPIALMEQSRHATR